MTHQARLRQGGSNNAFTTRFKGKQGGQWAQTCGCGSGGRGISCSNALASPREFASTIDDGSLSPLTFGSTASSDISALQTELIAARAREVESAARADALSIALATLKPSAQSSVECQGCRTSESRLNETLQALVHARAEAQAASDTLHTQAQATEAVRCELTAVLAGKAASEERCRQLTAEMQRASQALDQFRRQVGSLQCVIRQKDAVVASAENRGAEVSRKLMEMEGRAGEACGRVSRLRDELTSTKAKLAEEKRSNIVLRSRLDALNQKLLEFVDSEPSYRRRVSLSGPSSPRNRKLAEKLRPEDSNSNSSPTARRTLDAHAVLLQGEVEDLKLRLGSANEHIATLASELSEASDIMQMQLQRGVALQEQLTSVSAAKAECDGMIAKLTSELASLQARLEAAANEIALLVQSRDEYHRALIEKSGSIVTAESRASESSALCRELEHQLQVLKREVASSHVTNEQLRETVSSLRAELDSKSTECVAMSKRCKSLEDQVARASQQAHAAATTCQQAPARLLVPQMMPRSS
jgi:chromosome segregation ATPase